MDSYSSRGNTIFCTFVTVLGTCAALNHLTTWLPQFQTTQTGSIKLDKVWDLTPNNHYKADQCTLSFDMDMNLDSEFHWNMHQLFVYVVASYNETSNKRNEVTLWDDIATKENVGMFKKMNAQMVEYLLRDQYHDLRGKDVRLHIRYRTMPIVGLMYLKEIAVFDFKVPDDYVRPEGGRDAGDRRPGRKGKKKSVA
eukprot:TRINITY_DN125569_c0_g1_i1.p1 TRINITY_DN125569_c0_g1~~TRINITY_DN125569_c0_g1_i1.p1  ORF type:complete len:196 (+),score=43.48 TRINITY_DN125569_c0_g1_i1:115-702(+)